MGSPARPIGRGLELDNDHALTAQKDGIEAALQSEERVLKEHGPSCYGRCRRRGSLQGIMNSTGPSFMHAFYWIPSSAHTSLLRAATPTDTVTT
jgi:hypothetical protein